MALYGDYFLFSKKGEDRFLLNLGGIANFTFLPGNGDTALAFATDTGPGNTLLDAFARALFNVPFDENALLAQNGRVDERLLDIFKSEPFFAKPFPKTIGPELFSPEWAQAAFRQLPKGSPNPYDLMATLHPPHRRYGGRSTAPHGPHYTQAQTLPQRRRRTQSADT